MGKISMLMKVGAGIGAVIGAREALSSRVEESLAGKVAIVMDGERFLGLITRIDLLNYLRRRVQ